MTRFVAVAVAASNRRSSYRKSSKVLPMWVFFIVMKIIPPWCHAFRARSAKVLGPFLFDEFEVVMDEALRHASTISSAVTRISRAICRSRIGEMSRPL